MNRIFLLITVVLVTACGARPNVSSPSVCPMPVAEQDAPSWQVDPQIAALFGEPPAAGRLPVNPTWSPDSTKVAYLRLSPRREGQTEQELWIYDMTNQKEMPVFSEEGLSAAEYSWCGAAKLVVIAGGDLHLVSLNGKTTRLTNTKAQELNAIGSPDGTRVGFVRDHNLFVMDLLTGRERQLTEGGSPEKSFGEVTWLYEEELGTEAGFGWSPDSRWLWVMETDLSAVTFRAIMGADDEMQAMPYPHPGDRNPVVHIGVIDLEAAAPAPRQINTGPASDVYLPMALWHPDSKRLLVVRIDRLQTSLDLLMCHASSGECRVVVEERDPRFVEILGEPRFLGKTDEILWLSQREGFSHIYRIALDGASIEQLTEGKWVVSEINAVDMKARQVIFTANVRSPVAYGLYRVSLDGDDIEEIALKKGCHEALFSPNLSYWLDTHSAVDRAPRIEIMRHGNEPVAMIAKGDEGVYSAPNVVTEMFPIETADGRSLMASLTRPAVIDETLRYPVLVIVYGGPHVQLVKDAFNELYQPWRDLLAGRGVLVFSVDGRGSTGRGHEFESSIRLELGKAELHDQLSGITYLRSQPYVDPHRIGVFGWSYGGTMALRMLLGTKDIVKTGVAVAPVTDWRFYDTAYTERYMQRPSDNPEGYAATSLIDRAVHLKTPLLLVHGIADENVHFTHSERMFDALVDAGKSFRTIFYPGKDHKISGTRTRVHLFTSITRFIEETL